MLVVVGGHSRNIGKSSVVAGLIRALPEARWTAVKITRHPHGTLAGPFFVLTEQTAMDRTDSGRYLAAGAQRSYWLQTTAGQLEQAMPALRRILEGSENAIVESNSVLEFLEADFYLVVLDFSVADFKKSSMRFIERAGAFVTLNEEAAAPPWKAAATRWFADKPRFRVAPPDYISAEFARFVRNRILPGVSRPVEKRPSR